jgi:hypothetical protein
MATVAFADRLLTTRKDEPHVYCTRGSFTLKVALRLGLREFLLSVHKNFPEGNLTSAAVVGFC